MADDVLEEFIHGNCTLPNERIFQFSFDDPEEALYQMGKSRTHFSDLIYDRQKFLVVQRFYYICQSRIDENMIKIRPESRLKLGFCFIDDERPNACAHHRADGAYLILLNDALIPLIFGFWSRAPAKGETNALKEEVSKPDRQVSISSERINALWDDIAADESEDSGKRYYLWEYIRVGMEAIIDHEFGHIISGHLESSHAVDFEISEYEMNSQNVSIEEARLKQIRELEADTFAANLGFQSFLSRYDQSRMAKPGTPYNHYYRNVIHAYQRFSLSLYVMFRIFGPYSEQIANMDTKKHPPTFIRLVQVSGILARLLNTRPALVKALDGVLNPALFEVAYCDITGFPYDATLQDFWLTDQSQSYGSSLARGLDELLRRREYPFIDRVRRF